MNALQIMSFHNSALQHLASLYLLDGRDSGLMNEPGRMSPPRTAIDTQPLDKPLRLHKLRFSTHPGWDALHEALWPLVVMAAQSASERAAKGGAAAAGAGSESSQAHDSDSGVRREPGRPPCGVCRCICRRVSIAGIPFASYGLQITLHQSTRSRLLRGATRQVQVSGGCA